MKWIRFLAASAALVATPAAAEVVESSADHFVTRDSAVVKAAPLETWFALTDPAGYWNKAHTWSGDAKNLSITAQAGGCFCERFPEKMGPGEPGLAGSVQHMVVVLARPLQVLRMRGALGPLQSEPADGVLTVTLQPDKASGGTKIVWEYMVSGHLRLPKPKIYTDVDGVMSEQLKLLSEKLGRVAVVDTKPVAKPAEPAAKIDSAKAPVAKPAASDAKPGSASSPAAAPTKAADTSPVDIGAAIDAMEKKPAAKPK